MAKRACLKKLLVPVFVALLTLSETALTLLETAPQLETAAADAVGTTASVDSCLGNFNSLIECTSSLSLFPSVP